METAWFVRGENGEVEGPLSGWMLKARTGGAVKPETLVRKGANGNWAPASSVKGLFTESSLLLSNGDRPKNGFRDSEGDEPVLFGRRSGQSSTCLSADPGPSALSFPLSPPTATVQHAAATSSPPLARMTRNRYLWLGVGATLTTALVVAIMSHKSSSPNAVSALIAETRAWIDSGSLADSDRIEEQLRSAKAKAIASDSSALEAISAAFRRAKGERLATVFLAAKDAIAEKELDKARSCLRECRFYGAGTGFLNKAIVLQNQLDEAVSERLAIEKLTGMSDAEFTQFKLTGTCKDDGITDPTLRDIRNATWKRCLPKLSRPKIAEPIPAIGTMGGQKPPEPGTGQRLGRSGIRNAHEEREIAGRLQAGENGTREEWRGRYKKRVEHYLFSDGHTPAKDAEMSHYVLEVPEGYAVVSKLAELHRKGQMNVASDS